MPIRVPVILHVATAAQISPVLGGWVARARLTAPRLGILTWCALKSGIDVGALVLASRGINNHWLTYVFLPIEAALILWALSYWQGQVAKLAMRLAIPLFLVAWLVLVAVVEDTGTFSQVGEPVHALLGLVAALFTVGTRAYGESDPLVRQDWFWICIGLALYFGTTATLTLLGAILVAQRPDLVDAAFKVKAVVDILAFAAITGGMVCPKPQPRSGVSFSPAPSA